MRTLLLLLIVCSTASAQYITEQVERDSTVLRYRRLGVTMIRTWQIADSSETMPDRCAIWDTTYVLPAKDGVKTIRFAYGPIEMGDRFNEHRCRDTSYEDAYGGGTGFAPGTEPIREPADRRSRESDPPRVIDPTPNDTVTTTYDSEGYVVATTTNNLTRGSARNRNWYLDPNKRLLAHSSYGYMGFLDSTHFTYDSAGRVLTETRIERIVAYSDSARRKLDYSGRSRRETRWHYDSLGRPAFTTGPAGDTGRAWHYIGSGTEPTDYYTTYAGSRGGDSSTIRNSLVRDEHGNPAGWTMTTRRSTGSTYDTILYAQRVGYMAIDRRGDTTSWMVREVDGNGNLRSVTWRGGKSRRGVEGNRIEHDYSPEGLRIATRIYLQENGKTRLWRRFRYLYTFGKVRKKQK